MSSGNKLLSTAVRGYAGSHPRIRRGVKAVVDAGGVVCWRCGLPIEPGSKWQLGHDDYDRRVYRGPEHVLCNLRAAGRKSQGVRRVSVVL